MNCSLCDNKNLLRFIVHCKRCKIYYCFECQKKIKNEKSITNNSSNNDTIIDIISDNKSKIAQHSIYLDRKDVTIESSLLQKLPTKFKTECCEITICGTCEVTNNICKYCTEKM